MTNEDDQYWEIERALAVFRAGAYAVDHSSSVNQSEPKIRSLEGMAVMLKRVQLEKILKLSRSHIYALMAKNQFHRPIRYGKGCGVYWIAEEVAEWLEKQIQNSRGSGGKKS